MGAIPADVDAESGPPTAVPLGHVVVALGLLVAGVVVALVGPAGLRGRLAVVHLFLAGWVCVTIAGAMTQFVPVWSGARLYSRRLAVVQLWLLTAGLGTLAGAFLTGRFALAPVGGLVAAAGFWTLAYNVGRTLARVDHLDATGWHFAAALAFLVAVTALGPVLAADLAVGVPLAGVAHAALRRTHATLAVFGVALTTVAGALYQLATMFTQTELGPRERAFRRVETAGLPLGVVALAAGRLTGTAWLARVGGLVVALAVLGLGVVLANRLRSTEVELSAMLTRYGVAAAVAVAWATTALVGWWSTPLGATYGHPTVGRPLLAAFIAFVVLGTLYHVVPFLVWVERYSDLLGFEQVPMIDDLYDRRVAAADLALLVVALCLALARAAGASVPGPVLPGPLAAIGIGLFVGNVALVLRHGGYRLRVLVGVEG